MYHVFEQDNWCGDKQKKLSPALPDWVPNYKYRIHSSDVSTINYLTWVHLILVPLPQLKQACSPNRAPANVKHKGCLPGTGEHWELFNCFLSEMEVNDLTGLIKATAFGNPSIPVAAS